MKGDGGTNFGSLELNDFLSAVKGHSGFEIRFDTRTRFSDGAFGSEKLVKVFALNVLPADQAVDSHTKR